MAEQAEATTTETTEATTTTEPETRFTQADLDRIVNERLERERKKYADYPELKKKAAAAMSDAERVAVEAEQRGRSAALAEVGQRLVRAEFRALAAGRVENLDELLDDLNLAKFVEEDGSIDSGAIAKAVARLAPPPPEDTTRKPGPRPDLSQGSKQTTALNSDALTEALKRAVGAR